MNRVSSLSPRARWLAALRLQPVDRLPFWPKLNAAYAAARAAPFAGASLDRLHDGIGSDRHEWVGNGCVDRRRSCGFASERKDGELVESFVTPHGTLTRRQRFDAASQSWHPVAMPVTTLEQVRIATAWYADTSAEPDPVAAGEARARCAALGESACTAAGVGESPLMAFVEHLAGPAAAQYLLSDHPDDVGELFAAMHRHLKRRMELSAEFSPADLLYLFENTSTTLISPDQYRHHCLPQIREYAEIARSRGRLVALHMCGHLKALLPDLATLPVAAFEAFTSPPVGNTTLMDGRRQCPDICLIGGTNAALWTRPAAEIVAELGRHLDALPHYRGLVITSAGVMPPIASPETIRTVADFVRGYAVRR